VVLTYLLHSGGKCDGQQDCAVPPSLQPQGLYTRGGSGVLMTETDRERATSASTSCEAGANEVREPWCQEKSSFFTTLGLLLTGRSDLSAC
jgi:hypothetical protein